MSKPRRETDPSRKANPVRDHNKTMSNYHMTISPMVLEDISKESERKRQEKNEAGMKKLMAWGGPNS
jgi:hypothetical protein